MSRGRPEGDYGPRLSDSWPGVYDPAGPPGEARDDEDPLRSGQRPSARSGRDERAGRAGGAKRGKDRRSGGDRGPAGPAADEDYDWIKYLGEGRSPSPPPARPREVRGPKGALPPGPTSGPRSAPAPQPPPRPLPVRRPPARPDPLTDPGLGARRNSRASGEYRRPLYDDLGPDQGIPASGSRQAVTRPRSPEPWLDSQEYKRPLYPPDGGGWDTRSTPVGAPDVFPTSPSRRRPDPLSPPTGTGRRALPPPGRVDSGDDWIASRAATDSDLRTPSRSLRKELTQRSLPAPADRMSVERRPLDDRPVPRDLPRDPPGPRSGPPTGTATQTGLDRRALALGQRGSARIAAPTKKARPGVGRKTRKTAGTAKPRAVRPPAAPANRRTTSTAAKGAGRRLKTLSRLPRRLMIAGGCVLLVLVAGAAYYLLAPQPVHAVTTPVRLGAFAESPTVDRYTAQALRNRIVAGAAGEVKNVVAAVYEQTTGPGTSLGPQIIVFIGGNLTGGGSASGFIGGLVSQMHGSFTTSAGKLGGQAACAPGSKNGPAECAWADNDTFGVMVSATLSATGLADEMRAMRPLVEHTVK